MSCHCFSPQAGNVGGFSKRKAGAGTALMDSELLLIDRTDDRGGTFGCADEETLSLETRRKTIPQK